MKENSIIMAILMLVVVVGLLPISIGLFEAGNKFFGVFPFLCFLSAVLHLFQAFRCRN